MTRLNFNAATVAPAVPFDAVPAGWYVGYMSASEMCPTKDGSGAYLKAEYTILAPAEYANRKLFDQINLQHSNPVAVEIGYKTLSAICHAVKVIQVQDSAQLHNIPLQIKVSLKPAGPGADGKHYEASNDIKGYKAVEGAVPQAQAPMAPPPQQFAPPPAQPQYQPPQQVAAPAPAWAPPPQVQQPVTAAPPPAAFQQPAAAPATPPWAAPVQAAPAPQQAAPAAAPPWATPGSAPQGQPGAPVPPWAQPQQ